MSNEAVIERVARALCALACVDPEQVGGSWDGGLLPRKAPAWTGWLGEAETALAALKAGDDLGGGLTIAGAAYWNMLYRNNVTDVATKAAEAMQQACLKARPVPIWECDEEGWIDDWFDAIRALELPL